MRDPRDTFTIKDWGAVGDDMPVPVGDLFLPPQFYAVVVPDDPALPFCNIGCAVERGRAICVDLRCVRRENGAPISGEILRELPLGTYTRAATRTNAFRLVRDGDEMRLVPAWGPPETFPVSFEEDGTPVYGAASEPIPPEQRFDQQYARWTGAPRHRGPLREEDLREVAATYRAAVAAQDPPTVAVAARFGVSRSTAGRWIAEARRRGELGAAVPRMAGEIVDEQEG